MTFQHSPLLPHQLPLSKGTKSQILSMNGMQMIKTKFNLISYQGYVHSRAIDLLEILRLKWIKQIEQTKVHLNNCLLTIQKVHFIELKFVLFVCPFDLSSFPKKTQMFRQASLKKVE